MNAHQARLWRRMISSLDAYEAGALSFSRAIGELEGALDAGEFRDRQLVREFYKHWGPLEVLNAVRGAEVTPAEAAAEIAEMRAFLLKWNPGPDEADQM